MVAKRTVQPISRRPACEAAPNRSMPVAATMTAICARSSQSRFRVTSVMALYGMRMPRVNVWLPDDLHHLLTVRDLSPSTLLQDAIRATVDDIDRRHILDELLELYPSDDPDETGNWTVWADETLREHIERRP